MESYLANLDVWCWRYRENVRNYPGLHLTATADACDALLHCLRVIRQEGLGATRAVPLKPLAPADEAKITGGQRYTAYATLRLVYSDVTEELRELCVSAAGATVRVEVTGEALPRLMQGLADVRAGRGDYSIGPPVGRRGKELRPMGDRDLASEDLWFWPCFGHLRPV